VLEINTINNYNKINDRIEKPIVIIKNEVTIIMIGLMNWDCPEKTL